MIITNFKLITKMGIGFTNMYIFVILGLHMVIASTVEVFIAAGISIEK